MNNIKKKIAGIACAFTMMLSSVTTCFSAFGEETSTDTAAVTTALTSEIVTAACETSQTEPEEVLTEQSISLYPNGEEAEQIITLNGLMPEGATAEAVDVSELHEGVSAYDITISSGEQDYQPGEANPIHVEISDPAISESVYIELWHIADDGTRERITEFSVTDNIISFEATAFSVYEIVTVPEPLPDGTTTAQTVEELDGQGFYISNKNYYFMNDLVDGFKIRKTAVNARDNASVWYFEKTDDDKYRIYTLIGDEQVYMKMTVNGNQGDMSLVSANDATAFDVTLLTNNNVAGFYISSLNCGLNMVGGANETGFAGRLNTSSDSGSKMILTYPPVTADDPADLDGKSFALIMTKLDKPAALMADDYPGNSDRRKAVEATIRNNPFVNGTNIYQTPDTDLTLWTFENIGGNKYYIMTRIDGSYKYLRISGRSNGASVTLADTPDSDCELTVVQGRGNYSGMIQIKNSAGMAVNLKSKKIANGFQGYTAGNGANEWLSLAQLSVIKDDDFVTNIAKKTSVSKIQEGQQVVVYTRVWDNADKAYKFYIVDYQGNLIPAYEIGENLEWHGLKIGTVFWEFTEYKNADGLPNYYYELQNTYSGNYLVRANANPAMFVKNQRGFGISVEKVWADRYSAAEHEPAYFALYKKSGGSETLVNGTLKQLKSPAASVKWFMNASAGCLSDYVVREVKPVSDPVVDADGNVTSFTGTAVPVGEGAADTVTIGVKKNGSSQMTDKEYSVSYAQGEVESSVVGSDLQNIRKDTVTNTPVTKGVRIRLSEWNGTAADRDFKAALPDGTFTLKLNGDAVNFGEFTSDENGMVAILYDYEKGENNIYTLTQTDAPVTWVGTDTPIRFFIEEVDGTDHVRILNPENDGWVNHKDISSDELIGDIIVYNKKLSLNMIKYAAGSNDPLARAEFDLFRGTKQPDGSYLQNYYPISGYEALVSGADGVIPKIDETLPPGRYFLREKRSPNGYEPFVDAIEFNISELGEVELVNAPIGVFLSSDTSQEGKVIVRIKAGNTRKDAQTANLIVIKKVEGAFGDRTKDFAFTLTVENSADEYFMWTLNEVTQESISSGDTFHLADGDTAVFILPLECEVTVTEAAEDYTASMQLNHAEVQNTDSIMFAFSATTELLVTNIRNGVLPTGIPDTLCKALLLFIVPVPPIGMLLYSKRKRKRVT